MSRHRCRWDVTVVTHAGLPEGAPDDQLLALALRREGLAVRFGAWNAPSFDWRASRMAVVRSAWDYPLAPRAWLQWIAAVSATTLLLNPPGLLAWNTDKRYLRQLQAVNVACVPTWFVEPGAPAVPAAPVLGPPLDVEAWIVKPAIGASARGVRRFSTQDFASQGVAYAQGLALEGAVLLQPYLAEVETLRERSLVFIAGKFTHAFTKPAFASNATGRTEVQPHTPSAEELRVAKAALAAAPLPTLYARVDLAPAPGGPLLMELELIEPDLALRLCPAAAAELARQCRLQLEWAE